MRIESTDGVTLSVRDLGGEGLPILFAHATGLNHAVWCPVSRRVNAGHHLAIDFRGHGQSSPPLSEQFHWDGFADDVLATVDALSLDAPVGIGHSKGGAALLLAEQRRPGTFRALWLYEPVVFPPDLPTDRPNPMAAGARRRRATFSDFDEAYRNYASKPPFDIISDEARWAYLRGGFDMTESGITLRCEPEHEARVYEMGARHHAFSHLGEVLCPVTVVRGRIEPGPAMVADRVAEALPGGRPLVLEHLGHFGPLEAPQEIAGLLTDFLRGLDDI